MAERCFAFLDLLGFKYYISTDKIGALSLIENYQAILKEKLFDKKISPPESYDDPKLRKLAEINLFDAVEYFIPFSDSIFITSEKPDMFIKQISTFLFSTFNFTSQNFKENLDEHGIYKGTTGDENVENWFPVLFRGGLSYGDVIPLEMTVIRQGKEYLMTNLTGSAVVDAINIERIDKGPRVFCNKDFRNKLTSKSLYFVMPLNRNGLYEILWPMIIYNDSNDCHNEIGNFNDLFFPALNLWKAFNHKEFGIHYYKFLKLIVISTIKYFEHRDSKKLAEDYIINIIKEYGIGLKERDLLGSDFI